MARVILAPGPKSFGFLVLLPLMMSFMYMKSTELAAHLYEPLTSVNWLEAVCWLTLKDSVPFVLPSMV